MLQCRFTLPIRAGGQSLGHHVWRVNSRGVAHNLDTAGRKGIQCDALYANLVCGATAPSINDVASGCVQQLGLISEGADIGSNPFVGLAATIGIVAAGLFIALYIAEKQSRSLQENELTLAKIKIEDLQAEVTRLQGRVAEGDKAKQDAEFWKVRLGQQEKEQLKLERALEIKDGQLESFMVVAQRQIKMLEDKVKVLQRDP